MTQTDSTFDEWCVVEMLGHRRTAGRIREVQLAGAGFLRLDVPATPGHTEQTQYIAPGSVYALHPVTEDLARSVAAHFRPEPVHRWELPTAGDDQGHVDVAACRRCGCTEDRACLGGCQWASDDDQIAAGLDPMDGDLCTACLPALRPAVAGRVISMPAEGVVDPPDASTSS